MRIDNIRGFGSIDEYIRAKLDEYSREEKSFETLFKYMFSETDNVMVETSDGYRIKKVTYGEFKANIIAKALSVAEALREVKAGGIIGLYMDNCVEWIEIFWAILMCGYKPLLMNTRLSDEALEGIIAEYSVGAVISDGKLFSVCTVTKDSLTYDREGQPLEREFGDEVLFMSSGTTDHVKLCGYTGENFYYQICDSVNIIEHCPEIKSHYEGNLKQLTLLPFYHVFGFIAVYLWFGFFSRTFVFPKDLNPTTIQNTVKKHKVTHIFAVPLVWEKVYAAAISKIKAKGDKTHRKFVRMTRLVNRLGKTGDKLARKYLREVREGLFGDSICFLITGGSHINPRVLEFFNGIGYHLANGYGMTEIGITSVEFSSDKKVLNFGSVGAPFGYTEYSVDGEGRLSVRGKTMASRILQGGVESLTDFEKWFDTNDVARFVNGRYFIDGRADDLIVCENGENLNPVLVESLINLKGVERACLFSDKNNDAMLLLSVSGCYSGSEIDRIYKDVCETLKNAKLSGSVKNILFTYEKLIGANEFKVSRRRIAAAYAAKRLNCFEYKDAERQVERIVSGLEGEVRDCFAEVLGREADTIGVGDDFFLELGGTSIDYFVLVDTVRNKFGTDVISGQGAKLSTVEDFCKYIKTPKE